MIKEIKSLVPFENKFWKLINNEAVISMFFLDYCWSRIYNKNVLVLFK